MALSCGYLQREYDFKVQNLNLLLFRSKSLRTPSNMLVINLAFCDFVMLAMGPIVVYNSFYKGYELGHAGCQLAGILTSYSGIAAGMTNAAIAYDRYNVITNPMEGGMLMGKAIMLIVLIYVYATPLVIAPYTMVWNRFVPGKILNILFNIFVIR